MTPSEARDVIDRRLVRYRSEFAEQAKQVSGEALEMFWDVAVDDLTKACSDVARGRESLDADSPLHDQLKRICTRYRSARIAERVRRGSVGQSGDRKGVASTMAKAGLLQEYEAIMTEVAFVFPIPTIHNAEARMRLAKELGRDAGNRIRKGETPQKELPF